MKIKTTQNTTLRIDADETGNAVTFYLRAESLFPEYSKTCKNHKPLNEEIPDFDESIDGFFYIADSFLSDGYYLN